MNAPNFVHPPVDDPRVIHWRKGEDEQNFGDYLSNYFLDRMLRYPKLEVDAFHLVGSVIDDNQIRRVLRHAGASDDGTVAFWACGIRDEAGIAPELKEQTLFFGVRGPISREALELPADTPLGDPGLLLPVIRPAPAEETPGRTYCIPHFLDTRSDAELLAMSGADDLLRPNVANNLAALETVIDAIASAEFVLSASLHGAIIACAYGRPFAFWDNGYLDLPLKWRDFSLSAGFEASFHTNIAEGRTAYEKHIEPHVSLPPLVPILDVCPFTIAPEMLLRALVVDGRLDGDQISEAVTCLDELAKGEEAERVQHYAIAEEYRARQRGAISQLARTGTRAVDSMKTVLRGLRRSR